MSELFSMDTWAQLCQLSTKGQTLRMSLLLFLPSLLKTWALLVLEVQHQSTTRVLNMLYPLIWETTSGKSVDCEVPWRSVTKWFSFSLYKSLTSQTQICCASVRHKCVALWDIFRSLWERCVTVESDTHTGTKVLSLPSCIVIFRLSSSSFLPHLLYPLFSFYKLSFTTKHFISPALSTCTMLPDVYQVTHSSEYCLYSHYDYIGWLHWFQNCFSISCLTKHLLGKKSF